MIRRPLIASLTCAIAAATVMPQLAAANGAASTRNIIFGTAAAAAGTLLIINHNKKVHQKYAEYDRQQAATAASRDRAEAAYVNEQAAYAHEASLVADYKHETAYQHGQVVARDREIAALEHSLLVAKANARRAQTIGAAPVAPAASRFVPATVVAARPETARPAHGAALAVPSSVVSYGWGQF